MKRTQDSRLPENIEAGKRIKAFRERLKITQTQLASRLGDSCTQGLVSKWENGRSAPEGYIRELASALGVTAEQIWEGRRYSSEGVEPVRNVELKRVLESPEWAHLTERQKSALAVLMNDIDISSDAVRLVLTALTPPPPRRR